MKVTFLALFACIVSISAKRDKAPGPAPTPISNVCSSYQIVKVFVAWDYALCQWVNEPGSGAAIPGCDASSATNIEKTTCYVNSLIAKANAAFKMAPLCVELETTVFPDVSCSETGSYYEGLDVTSTSGSGSLPDTFVPRLIELFGPLSREPVKHMMAGSNVGTNIGYAYYNQLCTTATKTAATWVRDDHWEYFAHELGHQLGAVNHVKGKEANQGDYIMEGFVQKGVFAPSSIADMRAYITSRVNPDGTCR